MNFSRRVPIPSFAIMADFRLADPARRLDALGTRAGQTMIHAASDEAFALVPHCHAPGTDVRVWRARNAFESGVRDNLLRQCMIQSVRAAVAEVALV